MTRRDEVAEGRKRRHEFAFLLAAILMVVPFQKAEALITGGVGNSAVADPGWPKGAATIFNNPARVAWWEGPPFGGGEWVAECRGEAKVFNAVLTDFTKLDVKTKRVIIHDGVGHSFWLNPNREPAKEAAARVDWTFQVWQPTNWEHLHKLPADLNPTEPGDAAHGPPSRIDVYTRGSLRWSEITVPAGLEVIDERLEAHGFTEADGIVLEGKVRDLATRQPIAARVKLERIEPQPKGGYLYPTVSQTVTDPQGRWVIKKTPSGWFRVVIEADGYVPRVVGYAQFDDQPGWHSYDGGPARPAPVTGRVTDDAGKPLADVEVRFHDVASIVDGRYESPNEYLSKTDADGRFRADQIPVGRATIWIHKPGYTRPGLGLAIATPTQDVELVMTQSAQVRITVDFTGAKRPKGYLVKMEPEGGAAIGKWSASGEIDAKNQILYDNVPPGLYVIQGQPNPSSGDQQSQPIKLDLKGGQTAEVTLSAK